ncbi:3-phosphoshikimate 1-carboxyvinyltransferase 1 [Sporosarcina pasteurii]|uniref:3-phosphoshikimate 1-carboxyvinyltransferase n=2 Tax=Sporosarcina pasteurii TaxID=1474 RepID=A0A380BMF1_SPOPA|nr:3-phosphoshikimate 1-carboxyvinyltransferase [Sporosarcina pasteurii]SUJ02727.1 3-phosphoshikimate 1-carboxyvinyltransferase 1 [Sporosarcina pasteurii]
MMKHLQTIHFKNNTVQGELKVPGDKSISHRAVMLGSIAEGKTTITGFLNGEDCLRTIENFKQLGVNIDNKGNTVEIHSPGVQNWTTPSEELYAGNSGTTARLMLGILASSNVEAVISGDESLSSRPMDRVTNPLREMGASIHSESGTDLLPLKITGTSLKAIDYENPVASAQVKSAILFAGLQAEGTTSVQEETVSRDHTEQMLRYFGADVRVSNGTASIRKGPKLQGQTVHVPGDISSAAFFIVAAGMTPGSSLTLTNVGLNPTRTGIIDVVKAMGVGVTISNESNENGEPVGTLVIHHQPLQGIEIGGDLIPRLIDELPIIALLATQAEGTTIIKDAAELRVKETDRIAAVTNELTKIGANIEATPDGMIIHGPTPLKGGTMDSYGDHRLGMMAGIASLIASEPITIQNPACIDISYPSFFEDLESVAQKS